MSETGLHTQQAMGLYWFRLYAGFVACVIQCPQSGMQRETTNVTDIETVIEIEMAGLDAEYEALVADHSVIYA